MLLRNSTAQVVSRQQPYTAFATWDTRFACRFERHCCRAARCAKRSRRQRCQASVIQSSIEANLALLQRRQLLAALATIAAAEPQVRARTAVASALSHSPAAFMWHWVQLELEFKSRSKYRECVKTRCSVPVHGAWTFQDRPTAKA